MSIPITGTLNSLSRFGLARLSIALDDRILAITESGALVPTERITSPRRASEGNEPRAGRIDRG